MESKKISLRVLALHVVLLAGFSLMQGCTTGDAPVSWLNWPFSTPQYEQYEPVIVPADEGMIEPLMPVPDYTPGITSEPYTPPAADRTYTVQKGDTLSTIAAMYGTTWKELAAYNNMSDPNRIYVGQELRIPASLGEPKPVKRAPAKKSSSSSRSIQQGTSYVIQRGDSLSKIAKRSGVTVAELKAANALTSDRIIAGKSLTIPRKGSVKTPAPKAAAAPKPAPKAVSASKPAAPAPAPAPLAEIEPVETSAAAPVYEHVLYPGETLEDVARQYGSSQKEIMMLNGITDPAAVKPGTKLLVPIPE